LNPEVKRARLRLLAATTVRHLKQKKTHLAQKDIADIEDLPQSGEGDRPAFGVALKCVCAMIDQEKSSSVRLNRELIRLLEYPLAAKVIIQGILTDCGLSDWKTTWPAYANEPLQGDDLAAAIARGCKLGDDMGIAVAIPQEYEKQLRDFFTTEDSPLDTATIRIIAETALRSNNLELAYAAAGAGLLQHGAATARFLLLRARSLPLWEIDRRDDCIKAAIALARRERDMNLIDEAIDLRRNVNGLSLGFSIFDDMVAEGHSSMDTEELNEVLQLEKEAREYPSFMPDDDFEKSQCRYCDAKNCPDRDAPYLPDELCTEEFDDDDDDMDDFPDFDTFLDDYLHDLPPELMSLIRKVYAKHGRNGSFPDPEELARKDPWLSDQFRRKMLEAEDEGLLPDLDRDWFSGRRPRKSKRNRR
jgi:hypothetical protein